MTTEQPSEIQKWLNVIALYDNEFKKWEARTTKIIRRYRDDNRNSDNLNSARFNILWSNVQTLMPAVYARMPKADVTRRFSDNDPVGRVASLLLERSLDFEIEHYSDFRSTMRYAVEDRFLGGRGTAWVRYDPHIVEQEVEVTETVGPGSGEGAPQNQAAGQEAAPEQIDYECSPCDYVHWKDYGHTPARTWEEVGQVWRWVYMGKEALEERFGKKLAKKIPLDSGPDPLGKNIDKNRNDKAKICELWDKDTETVYWFSKSLPEFLDTREDPLELEGFFPCPKPLLATTTSDSLVPIPDFVLYQDQAEELDILSDRIDGLVKALRMRGVYDSSQPALQRLLTEGENNTLIPVDKWAAFAEKGGLKGTIDLLPLDVLGQALLNAYQARTEIKGQIYEITGISDIIRGETAASETATAQQIKGQYAGLRLKSMQESVAMFASELLRLKAQVMCAKYQPETILKYAAADQLSDTDKQMIPEALQLMSKSPLRSFRIEVAADSLVQIDEQQNKQDRLEFLKAFGDFMAQAVPAGQAIPEMGAPLMEMAKYAVAGFKQARAIEGTIDTALEQLKAKAADPNKPPSPEAQKVQAEQQGKQAELQANTQIKQAEMAQEAQAEQARLASQEHIRQMELDADAEAKRAELTAKAQETQMTQAFDKWKAELEASTKLMIARMTADPGMAFKEAPDVMNAAAETLTKDLGGKMDQLTQHITNAHNSMMDAHGKMIQHIANMTQAVSAPKRVVRGPDGKVSGIVPATTMQ